MSALAELLGLTDVRLVTLGDLVRILRRSIPEIRALMEEAERLRAEREWRPIETAPRDGRMALVYRPLARESHDQPISIKHLVPEDNDCWPCTVPKGQVPFNPTDGCCHVTHWMPLTPPAAESPNAKLEGRS